MKKYLILVLFILFIVDVVGQSHYYINYDDNQKFVLNLDSMSFKCWLSYFEDNEDVIVTNPECNNSESDSKEYIEFINNDDIFIEPIPDILGTMIKLEGDINNIWQLCSTLNDTILITISDSAICVIESSHNVIQRQSLFFIPSMQIDDLYILGPKWKDGKRDGNWGFIDLNNNVNYSIIYDEGTILDTCFIKKL